MKNRLLHRKADYIGITGSVLCLIHCLVTPVVVLTSTMLNRDSLRVGFLSLDYVFIGVNVLAVWSASRHTSGIIKTSFWLCLVLFVAALLLEDWHEAFVYLAYGASAGLVLTHLANIRYCQTHPVH